MVGIRCDTSIIYIRQNIYSFGKLTRMMEFISGGVTCLALSMAPMTCCWCWNKVSIWSHIHTDRMWNKNGYNNIKLVESWMVWIKRLQIRRGKFDSQALEAKRTYEHRRVITSCDKYGSTWAQIPFSLFTISAWKGKIGETEDQTSEQPDLGCWKNWWQETVITCLCISIFRP